MLTFLMFPSLPRASFKFSRWLILAFATFGLASVTASCNLLPKQEAQAQSESPDRGEGGPTAVETTIAETSSLEESIEYTGTTEPVRLVSLRSQAEGRLLDLTVDVGDPVTRGQRLGQVDDRLLTTLLNQAEAELAARQSEVAQAEAEVSSAQAQVGQAQAELEQARSDANRLRSLFEAGAGTEQAAEQAETAVRTAEQTLRSAEELVRTRQQAVVAAQGRAEAQRSAVLEEQERRQYSLLVSPLDGVVLQRFTEPGNLLQPGEEVVQLGDFSALKVMVQVSELELATVRVGQSVQVRLDAFPDQAFRGQVTRISPAADPTARLIPVEITIPNPGAQMGSGLLARVRFQSAQAEQIVVPESALEAAGQSEQPTVFVIEGQGEDASVKAQTVEVGNRLNGRVEIRSGLEPGEAYVVRSSQPLKDGQAVRLSVLSETAQ